MIIYFEDNAGVIVNPKGEMKGSAVSGPVAKEAADVVLADDDFTTITHAVAEGKGIFFNIRNFLSFQLSTSFAALAMESVATAFSLPSPLNAMQILWINIIMDGPPAQSLGVEPVDERILRAPPRKVTDPIVTRALLTRAISSAALIMFLTLKVFSHELEDGVTRRDTTMTFMTFVNCDLFNAYACRSADKCFYEISPFSNPSFLWAMAFSVAGQFAVIYFPPLQSVFQTEALSFRDLLLIVCLSSTVLMLDTIRKKCFQQHCGNNVSACPPKDAAASSTSALPAAQGTCMNLLAMDSGDTDAQEMFGSLLKSGKFDAVACAYVDSLRGGGGEQKEGRESTSMVEMTAKKGVISENYLSPGHSQQSPSLSLQIV